MANNPFDRTIINVRERPLSSDVDQLQSQIDRAIRDILRRMFQFSGAPQSGFLDTSLKVVQNSPTGMSVLVTPGVGLQDLPSDVPSAIGGITGVDDLSPYKPLPLNANQQINVDAAPPAGQERYDIIEVKTDRRAENPLSRDILNTATGVFEPGSVNKTLAFSLDGRNGRVVSPANSTTGIGYKVGVAAAVGTAVVPSTSPGYIPLCTIYVGPTVTQILDTNITDRRTILNARGLWNRVVATADTSNSASPATDIAGLTFPCVSGKRYLVRAHLFVYAAATTTGLGIGAKATGAPTTSEAFFNHKHWIDPPAYSLTVQAGFADSPVVLASTASISPGAPQVDEFEGSFVTTGAGIFQLRLLTEVATSQVTSKAGSYLEWLEL